MTKPEKRVRKPRKSVVKESNVEMNKRPETPQNTEYVKSDDWKEEKPRRNRKTNKFCVDCLDLELCVKEKLAMVIFCDNKRIQ